MELIIIRNSKNHYKNKIVPNAIEYIEKNYTNVEIRSEVLIVANRKNDTSTIPIGFVFYIHQLVEVNRQSLQQRLYKTLLNLHMIDKIKFQNQSENARNRMNQRYFSKVKRIFHSAKKLAQLASMLEPDYYYSLHDKVYKVK